MENISCPHCSGAVLNDPRLAGQVVACPTCRNPFRMPSADPAPNPPSPGSVPTPSPPPSPAVPTKPSSPTPAEKKTPEDKKGTSEKKALPTPAKPASSDPWYLASTERYYWLLPFLALGTGALALILGVGMLVWFLSVSRGDFWTIFFGLVGFLLYLAAIGWFVILSVVLVSLIRLWLASAKNLQELRRKLEKK